MKPSEYISASKIKLFNTCQCCFYLRYVVGLPQPEKDYFITGKKVEESLKAALTGEEQGNEWEDQLAKVLFKHNKFQELVKGEELLFQNELIGDIDGVPFLGYTDIETSTRVLDVKTSAGKWTSKTVQDYKIQAIAYSFLTQKEFSFAVVRKSKRPTLEDVQIINVSPSEESIRDFKSQVKIVWDAWQNDLLSRVHSGGYMCHFKNINP